MGDYLAVGLRAKPVTGVRQLNAEVKVVFDDPVVNYRHAAVRARVGMGVRDGDTAVGGPARVGDADGRLDAIV